MNGPRKINVIGIVAKGTKIKAIKLVKQTGWMIGFGSSEKLAVYGEILSGPYADKIVNMRDISIYYRKPWIKLYVNKPEKGIIAPVNESGDM